MKFLHRLPIALLFIALLSALHSNAQEHNTSSQYVWPKDTLVMNKLQNWQDQKFGLLMHWGTYSQWGVVESWSICPEDEGWCERRGQYGNNYFDYKQAYENLQTTFNPTKFNPDKWAAAAKNAGMKYVVFTTKHHDGFCMFDTKETDYRITSSKTPFSSNPRSNIAKEVFNAFRKDNFLIGAYFSKPDWHSPYFWWPYFPPKDRNVNYEISKHSARWDSFKLFTYNQIKELMTNYGKMDILWLDGGWVRPLSSVDTSVDWQRGIRQNQDVDMNSIIKMARTYQPGLLSVDRTVSGENENYVTPEQTVPAEPLDHPWESCITMGNSWSYVPNDHYKTANELVQLLVKIVSRGGNLLLNIGPSPEGDFADTAYARLNDIGNWMKVHSNGIYKTIPLQPYEENNIVYLQSKDEKKQFIYVLADKADENVKMPATIQLNKYAIRKGSKIKLIDAPGKITWQAKENGSLIQIPKSLQNKTVGKYAVAFEITQ